MIEYFEYLNGELKKHYLLYPDASPKVVKRGRIVKIKTGRFGFVISVSPEMTEKVIHAIQRGEKAVITSRIYRSGLCGLFCPQIVTTIEG